MTIVTPSTPGGASKRAHPTERSEENGDRPDRQSSGGEEENREARRDEPESVKKAKTTGIMGRDLSTEAEEEQEQGKSRTETVAIVSFPSLPSFPLPLPLPPSPSRRGDGEPLVDEGHTSSLPETFSPPGCAPASLVSPRPAHARLQEDLTNRSRTLYLGGITADITANDIFNHVRGGAVEALRFLVDRHCAFLDFVDEAGAATYYHERLPARCKKFTVRERDIRVAWAKSTLMTEQMRTALRNGATRCVYIGGLRGLGDELATTVAETGPHVQGLEDLRTRLKRTFEGLPGSVEQLRVVPELKAAFIHMTCVADAMRAVDALGKSPEWSGYRISFGKDRCSRLKTRDDPNLPLPSNPVPIQGGGGGDTGDLNKGGAGTPHSQPIHNNGSNIQGGLSSSSSSSRTVYLGGMPEGATAEDLCNVIRGGQLEKIRMSPEKHCAFVTFVEATAAAAFYALASEGLGVWVRGVRLRAGWGQPSILPRAVLAALRQGASRTLYLGNVDSVRLGGEEGVRTMFAPHGTLEQVHFLRGGNAGSASKSVLFVSYCCLLDAVRALEATRSDPLFQHCTLAYGRDRCAQPLRTELLSTGLMMSVNTAGGSTGVASPLMLSPHSPSSLDATPSLAVTPQLSLSSLSYHPSSPYLHLYPHSLYAPTATPTPSSSSCSSSSYLLHYASPHMILYPPLPSLQQSSVTSYPSISSAIPHHYPHSHSHSHSHPYHSSHLSGSQLQHPFQASPSIGAAHMGGCPAHLQPQSSSPTPEDGN